MCVCMGNGGGIAVLISVVAFKLKLAPKMWVTSVVKASLRLQTYRYIYMYICLFRCVSAQIKYSQRWLSK